MLRRNGLRGVLEHWVQVGIVTWVGLHMWRRGIRCSIIIWRHRWITRWNHVWSWRDIGITFWRGTAARTGKLEGGGNRSHIRLNFDPLTNEDLVQAFQIKARNTAFKDGIALSEFLFEMFGVTAKSERLAVPVLLMTRSARGCASGASWVFRITLYLLTSTAGARLMRATKTTWLGRGRRFAVFGLLPFSPWWGRGLSLSLWWLLWIDVGLLLIHLLDRILRLRRTDVELGMWW